MQTSTESIVVGVRFSKVGKVYHFEANGLIDLKPGDHVVVETSRGWQLGQVAQILDGVEKPPEGWKPIDRRATPRDLLLRQLWQQKEAEVVENCKTRANELNLAGIKIVSAEYSFDGSRLTILFSSETEEKYDLKSLRGDMQKMLSPSQVEMRQIGPRDVAKLLCGMGACGKETRCCCAFLTEFSSISIRMAKEQGISLTPSEITGMCGRLRCCLIYEYDQYVEARKSLPKRNKRVRTPDGEGKVVDVVPLREAVLVELPDVGVREYPGANVVVLDGEGTARPAAAPVEETAIPVVTQPSEIDQVLSGEEITPDRVEGVGDTGSLGPVSSGRNSYSVPQHSPSRDNRTRPGGGPRSESAAPAESPERGESARQPGKNRRAGGRDRPALQGRGGQGRGPQNRGSSEQPRAAQDGQDPDVQEAGEAQNKAQQNAPQGRASQGRGGPGNRPGRRDTPRGKTPPDRKPTGAGAQRPPQDRGTTKDEPGESPEKGSSRPEGKNRQFRNKRKGHPHHGRDDNEAGA